MSEETAVDKAERLLIQRMINGIYPPHSELPGERTLSQELEVARPALREALQRLSRDGWLEIQQGKSTRVRDYLRDGNINILQGMLKTDPRLIPELIPSLLEMWGLFAPVYTAAAVRRVPGLIVDQLTAYESLPEDPEAYAKAMWDLHRTLIDYCGNLVYGLIFNAFTSFYYQLGIQYYITAEHREEARRVWARLREATEEIDTRKAGKVMNLSFHITREYWKNPVTYPIGETEVAEVDEETES